MIKIIGIGNILLGDDGVGPRIIESLSKKNFPSNVMLIKGECDYLYCLESITCDDFIIIIDSCFFEKPIGSITSFSLKECDMLFSPFSISHEYNLVKLLHSFYPEIEGIFIGIEVHSLSPSLSLSSELEALFPTILEEIYRLIQHILGS